MAQFENYEAPTQGEKITIQDGKLQVPNQPVIPFIEGDGTGPDIWAASRRVLDAAVEKAYKARRRLPGMKCMQGRKLLTNTTTGFLMIR